MIIDYMLGMSWKRFNFVTKGNIFKKKGVVF